MVVPMNSHTIYIISGNYFLFLQSVVLLKNVHYNFLFVLEIQDNIN
jgi:hypothetical protein